jgi:hypothetical protein
MSGRQVAHLTGGNCWKTPHRLIYQTAKDFDELRSLRNPDKTCGAFLFPRNSAGRRLSYCSIGDWGGNVEVRSKIGGYGDVACFLRSDQRSPI